MKRSIFQRTAAAVLIAAGAAGLAHAAPDAEAVRERLQSMTPEQRAAAREKMRERWEAMTPAQREAAKKRFAERHPDAGQRAARRQQGAPAPATGASAAR